jgi:hypothetical protein
MASEPVALRQVTLDPIALWALSTRRAMRDDAVAALRRGWSRP